MASFVSTFPVVVDVVAVLTAMGLSTGDIAALPIQSELDAIESKLMEACGGAFLVEPNAPLTTLRHQPPDGVVLALKAPFVSSPDAPLIQVQLASVDEPLVDLLEGEDYTLWPETAPQRGLPYTGLVFEHSIRCSRNGVLVTGLLGFGTKLSKDRWNAIVGGVIYRLYPTISARLKASGSASNGAVKAKQIGQLREEYVTLDAEKVAAFKTEAPLLGQRFDELLETLRCKKPLTA